jgi:polyhydroxyalkanoate synthesis regulator phasin
MSDLISKALLSGLGLASLTKDAIRKTAEDLVKKSDLSEKEGKRLVKELHRRSAKAQKTMEKTIESAVNNLLKHLNLAVVHQLPRKPARRGGKRAGKSGRTRRAAGSGKA